MKDSLIHHLLRRYSYLVCVIILFFGTSLSYVNWQGHSHAIRAIQDDVAEVLYSTLALDEDSLRSYFYDYSLDTDKMDSLYRYFSLSPSDYQTWLVHHPLLFNKQLSVPETLSNLYRDNDFITGVSIALADEQKVLVSSKDFKSGNFVATKDYHVRKNSFSMTLYDPSQLTVLGTIYVTIDTNTLTNLIHQKTDLPLVVTVLDRNLNQEIYAYHNTRKGSKLTSISDDDVRVEVAVEYSYLNTEMIRVTVLIMGVSLVLIVLLLLVLRHVFYSYQVQVEDLVETMQTITEKDHQVRIDTTDKTREIYLISTKMNTMLDSLDKSIEAIYSLELAQKEANLRALQSQINPHFLYNTLEFFRMYSVTHQMDDLADMIYRFSALLRGSISKSDMTTLKEELELCETYSYICQIRYPKSIAYSYQIEEDCEKVIIPRFVIQPLVENYFIHGVDLTRQNNAISVRASREKNNLVLVISDNGKGMSGETLSYYQEQLKKRDVISSTTKKSLGILNSHERLCLYFGESYEITLDSMRGGGICYQIRLKGV